MKEETDAINQVEELNSFLSWIGSLDNNCQEDAELFNRAKNGDYKERNILIEKNLRLVHYIAREYASKGSKLDFEDLVQEGTIGLISAIERFDSSLGCGFYSYAKYWVRQSIVRAIRDCGSNIRIPSHLHDSLNLYNKTICELSKKLQRKPTLEEIAEEAKLPVKKIIELERCSFDTISLNTLIGDNIEDEQLQNLIPINEKTLEEKLIYHELLQSVSELLQKVKLQDVEKEILEYRFCLNGKSKKNLIELAGIYNVSPERIRQLEKRALTKIRKSPYTYSFAMRMDYPTSALGERNKPKSSHARKNQKTEKVQSKKRKITSVYEQFEEYSKEQVDNMLLKLTEEEQTLLDRYYKEVADREEKNNFRYYLLPKMKRILGSPNWKPKYAKTIYERFSIYSKEQVDSMLLKLTEEEKKQVLRRWGSDLEHPVNTGAFAEDERIKFYRLLEKMERILKKEKKLAAETIDKEDYQNIILTLKSEKFKKMLEIFSEKEAVIICLNQGYIIEKSFSVECIARFLELPVEEVKNIIKRYSVLKKRKEYSEANEDIKTMSLVKKKKTNTKS